MFMKRPTQQTTHTAFTAVVAALVLISVPIFILVSPEENLLKAVICISLVIGALYVLRSKAKTYLQEVNLTNNSGAELKANGKSENAHKSNKALLT